MVVGRKRPAMLALLCGEERGLICIYVWDCLVGAGLLFLT